MRTLIVLIAATLVLVGAPVAAADETHPDCEANQPWIGYRNTLFVRDTYNNNGAPGGLNVCEGEHWDGQDPVSSAPGDCAGMVNPDPDNLLVGICLDQDPNTMAGDDALNPLGLRISADASNGQVYSAANIALLGRAVVYADEGTAAVYLRDNTPNNVLATVVSALRVTQGYVSENDCDQALYQQGAMSGTALCGRDNTAITVEHGLIP